MTNCCGQQPLLFVMLLYPGPGAIRSVSILVCVSVGLASTYHRVVLPNYDNEKL